MFGKLELCENFGKLAWKHPCNIRTYDKHFQIPPFFNNDVINVAFFKWIMWNTPVCKGRRKKSVEKLDDYSHNMDMISKKPLLRNKPVESCTLLGNNNMLTLPNNIIFW